MPPVGFEPTISAGERPQTYASDRAATGTGSMPECTGEMILSSCTLDAESDQPTTTTETVGQGSDCVWETGYGAQPRFVTSRK